ncbi:MAG: phosphoribosylglycinamide formyltransferase [Candidatus Edwardsbacteria bacterium]|nr:phosphoribosylglycinamide formyltransferase [Candidatus Edwardsbacteria bacterium]
MSRALRTTVLISGSGSNLQALIDACGAGKIPAQIIHVISNVAAAPGLQRARQAGIGTSVLEHGGFADRADFDRALALLIAAGEPQLVVLAGFMRIIGPAVLEPFRGRIINLHPSLLPLYPGTGTYQRALDAGDRQHGASIHFVTGELDGGPVISQVVVPVLAGDDAASLAARLGPQEHRLVVATVELFATRRVESRDGDVLVDGERLARPLRLQADDRLVA